MREIRDRSNCLPIVIASNSMAIPSEAPHQRLTHLVGQSVEHLLPPALSLMPTANYVQQRLPIFYHLSVLQYNSYRII